MSTLHANARHTTNGTAKTRIPIGGPYNWDCVNRMSATHEMINSKPAMNTYGATVAASSATLNCESFSAAPPVRELLAARRPATVVPAQPNNPTIFVLKCPPNHVAAG